jgi:hypothetical protein
MIHRLYRFQILREEPSPLIAAMDEANGAQVWLAPIRFDPARRATQTAELVAIADSLEAEKFTANGHFYLIGSSEAEALDLLTHALACTSIAGEKKREISDGEQGDPGRKDDKDSSSESQPTKPDRARIFLLVALAAAALLIVIFIIANSR